VAMDTLQKPFAPHRLGAGRVLLLMGQFAKGRAALG
jgi:hypothetical protein